MEQGNGGEWWKRNKPGTISAAAGRSDCRLQMFVQPPPTHPSQPRTLSTPELHRQRRPKIDQDEVNGSTSGVQVPFTSLSMFTFDVQSSTGSALDGSRLDPTRILEGGLLCGEVDVVHSCHVCCCCCCVQLVLRCVSMCSGPSGTDGWNIEQTGRPTRASRRRGSRVPFPPSSPSLLLP